MTLYLLDANVLITADAQYYEMSRVPEFWEWLAHQGETDQAKIPQEVFDEITMGKGALVDWLKEPEHKKALLLNEEVNQALVTQVIEKGYGQGLTDDQIEAIGRDPFLIAYGVASPSDRCVVSTEVSKPTATKHNRKIPDVCQTLNVKCINAFEFVRQLDFRTNWNR